MIVLCFFSSRMVGRWVDYGHMDVDVKQEDFRLQVSNNSTKIFNLQENNPCNKRSYRCVIQMSQITLQTMQLGCHPINMKLIRYSCFCYGKLNDLTMDLQRRVCAIYLAADLQTLWQGQKPPSAASTRPQATALSLKSPLLCSLKTLQRLTRQF